MTWRTVMAFLAVTALAYGPSRQAVAADTPRVVNHRPAPPAHTDPPSWNALHADPSWRATRRTYHVGLGTFLAGPVLVATGSALMECGGFFNCSGGEVPIVAGAVALTLGPMLANGGARANTRMLARAGYPVRPGLSTVGLILGGTGAASLAVGMALSAAGVETSPILGVWVLASPVSALLAVVEMSRNRHVARHHAPREGGARVTLLPATVSRSPGLLLSIRAPR